MKRRLLIYPAVAFMMLVILTGGMQEYDLRYERIRANLAYFSAAYPQQKVYLHTDKDQYNGGDEVWIKAYLVNSLAHLPDSLSSNLYVELFGPDHSLIEVKIFQLFNGLATGQVSLSDTLPEGLYQIRAYTNWMRNFHTDYFFTKNFQLNNPVYSGLISPRQARINEREISRRSRQHANFDVQFMPEGGNLVYGLESVVAFKAVNELGFGIDVHGNVYDNKDNLITSFESFHKGMGKFRLNPEDKRKYYALVDYGEEQIKVDLPRPESSGTVMRVEDEGNAFRITLATNQISSNDPDANEVIVTGQVRGIIYFHTVSNLQKGRAVLLIDKAVFPSGIVQLTLFSGRSMPIAERLIYIDHRDHMRIGFNVSDILTSEGYKTRIELRTTDRFRRPLQSNLSLSVFRNLQDRPPANNENIISYLMLSSDLTGYIEDPSYYFSDDDYGMEALDVLMLTQGWRRFEWHDIVAGVFPEIEHFEENGLTIEGRILHNFFDIPLKDSEVRLTIMDQFNDVFTQITGEDGSFRFDNLFFYDTINIKVEAWRKSGRRNLVIRMQDQEIREIGEYYGDYSLTTESARDNRTYRREQALKENMAYREAQRREEEADSNKLSGIHSAPDNVLYADDIPIGARDIFEAIKGRVPGVNVQGDEIIIRGPNSFYSSTQPLFLVDNLPVESVESIRSIPVETVERIEVIKGPGAAIYGVRGGNGVIAIYTKRGYNVNRGELGLDVVGYTAPRSFYQPKYLPEDEPAENYTVLWQPMIQTNENGRAVVLLDKPAIEGDYKFVVEGISLSGKAGHYDIVIDNQN